MKEVEEEYRIEVGDIEGPAPEDEPTTKRATEDLYLDGTGIFDISKLGKGLAAIA